MGLCAFICPVLDSKQDSLQFSAVLLQTFCDTCPVLGTFFKGVVVQKAQELHFLWWFSGTAQCLTTCSFLSCSLLLPLSSLGPSCYLTSAFLLLWMSGMYLSPCLCSCHPSAMLLCGACRAARLCMVFSGYFYEEASSAHPCAAGPHVSQPWDCHLWAGMAFCSPDTHSAVHCLAFQAESRPLFERTLGALRVSGKLFSGVSI